MVLLIAFWSLKWAKNEGGLCSVHSKASWISKHEKSKSWKASKPLPIQSSEQGGESEKKFNIHQFHKLPFNLRNWWGVCTAGQRATKLKEFRKSLLTCKNSPCINLGYFPADSVRFLFQDILCNVLFSPYNQLKIFSDIIISWRSFVFRFLGYFSEGLKISLYICLRISPFVISISNSRKKFLGITCTFLLVSKKTEFCSALPSHFVFYFLSSQTPFEDVFSKDEWLDFFVSWTKGS